MSDLGLEVLDRTVQETNEWLRELMSELDTDDRQEAYHALRSVLFGLRDRIPTTQSANFAAQLPMLIRGIYYEGFKPADQPKSYRALDDWKKEVTSYYDVAEEVDPEQVTRAVFAVLSLRLDDGVVQKVYNALPESIRSLWPGVSEEVARQH